MWAWGCPTYAQKQAKNAFFVFLGCFWAYVGQPHSHISWATPMPFASINSTNPRTNPWNFQEKILRIGGAGKWAFFSRPFWICFFPMTKTLVFIWGIIFFCTMDGFFRILEKRLSELICTWLYISQLFKFCYASVCSVVYKF